MENALLATFNSVAHNKDTLMEKLNSVSHQIYKIVSNTRNDFITTEDFVLISYVYKDMCLIIKNVECISQLWTDIFKQRIDEVIEADKCDIRQKMEQLNDDINEFVTVKFHLITLYDYNPEKLKELKDK